MKNPTIDLIETIESFDNEIIKLKLYKNITNYLNFEDEIKQSDVLKLILSIVTQYKLEDSKIFERIVGYWSNKSLYAVIKNQWSVSDIEAFWQDSRATSIINNALDIGLLTKDEFNKYIDLIKKNSLEELLKKGN